MAVTGTCEGRNTWNDKLTQNANQRGGLNSSTRSLKISDHSVWLSYIEFEQVGILIWVEYCSYIKYYFKFYNLKLLVSLWGKKRQEKSWVKNSYKIGRLFLMYLSMSSWLVKSFTLTFSFFWITTVSETKRFCCSC